MNLSAALVVYIVVAVISGVIRRLAERKTIDKRRTERPIGVGDDAVLFDEIDSATEIFAEMEFETEHRDERELKTAPASGRSRGRKWRPNMAQAVIMSEILRSPRAKRPWPHR